MEPILVVYKKARYDPKVIKWFIIYFPKKLKVMEKVKLIHMSKNSEEQFRLFIWFIVERLQGVSYHLFC